MFITNGCCTDTSCYGDQTHAPDLSGIHNGCGESWDMWKAIARQAQHGEYGNPDAFCSDVEATNWMSATVATADEEVIRHIMNICKRDPRAGKVTTGGIVTVKDSVDHWYLSWTINRQPQFKSQDKNTVLVWVYGLHTDCEGNYVRKAMRECTGEEICREWLYHIGIPEDRIEELATTACNTTTCYMPYINAFFQPRKESDRPKVVPDGAVNFAFIGQFAETPRDTIFTTEYSMRTGMESVYTLLDIDRGVPEVWGSKYDVRELLRACYYAVDKKPISELPLSFGEREAVKILLKKVKGTDVELLLRESGLLVPMVSSARAFLSKSFPADRAVNISPYRWFCHRYGPFLLPRRNMLSPPSLFFRRGRSRYFSRSFLRFGLGNGGDKRLGDLALPAALDVKIPDETKDQRPDEIDKQVLHGIVQPDIQVPAKAQLLPVYRHTGDIPNGHRDVHIGGVQHHGGDAVDNGILLHIH